MNFVLLRIQILNKKIGGGRGGGGLVWGGGGWMVGWGGGWSR